jgi:hypothetical protein
LDELLERLRDLAGVKPARIGAPIELELLEHLKALFNDIERVDAAPTPVLRSAVDNIDRAAPRVVEQWQTIETHDLPALNKELEAAGLAKIVLTASDSSE